MGRGTVKSQETQRAMIEKADVSHSSGDQSSLYFTIWPMQGNLTPTENLGYFFAPDNITSAAKTVTVTIQDFVFRGHGIVFLSCSTYNGKNELTDTLRRINGTITDIDTNEVLAREYLALRGSTTGTLTNSLTAIIDVDGIRRVKIVISARIAKGAEDFEGRFFVNSAAIGNVWASVLDEPIITIT